jgi:hypothetical protein
MIPKWAIPASVAFGTIAILGGVAYYLERSRRELRWATTEAFKEGGWLSGFYQSVKGVVTEGSPDDFTVDGTFQPTAAQLVRSQPRKV